MQKHAELLDQVCRLDLYGNVKITGGHASVESGLKWLCSRCDLTNLNETEKQKIERVCKRYLKLYFDADALLFLEELDNKQKERLSYCKKSIKTCYDMLDSMIFAHIVKPLHEHFRDYTVEDFQRNAVKCSTCKFSGRILPVEGGGKIPCCNYLLYTGNSRKDRPELCTKYVSKNTDVTC